MAKVDYAELMGYRQQMRKSLMLLRDRLDGLRGRFVDMAHTDSIGGSAADSARSYVQEVHVDGLLQGLVTVAENLERKLSVYVAGYSQVDGDYGFRASDESFDDVEKALRQARHGFEQQVGRVRAVMGRVASLCSTSGVGVVTGCGQDVESVFGDLHLRARRVRDEWHRYENTRRGDFDDVLQALSRIESLIGRYASGGVPAAGEYASGGFGSLAGEEFAGLLAGLDSYNRKEAVLSDEADAYIRRRQEDSSDEAVLHEFFLANGGYKDARKLARALKQAYIGARFTRLADGSLVMRAVSGAFKRFDEAAGLAKLFRGDGVVRLSDGSTLTRRGRGLVGVRGAGLADPDLLTKGRAGRWGQVLKNTGVAAGKAGWSALKDRAGFGFGDSFSALRSARGLGRVVPGLNIVSGALDVAEGVSQSQRLAEQDGLSGGQVAASQAGGIAIAAVKAGAVVAGSVVAAGLASAFVAATAPAWAVVGAGAGVAFGFGWVLNKANEQSGFTEGLKHGWNSVVKGISGWFQ